MQQRVSICRALVHDPPLLMEEQKTVVFVTHSIPEAVQLADRVIVMGPRPSIIERSLEIDLARPRHRAVQESTRFSEYVKESTDIFMVRGVLHD